MHETTAEKPVIENEETSANIEPKSSEVVKVEPTPQQVWQTEDSKVKKGAKAFIQVGLALTKIKKEKLYKLGGYKTFGEYVADRIDMSEQQTRKIRNAAEIAKGLKLSGEKVLPTHESQIRALAKFKDDKSKYREIWAKAVGTAENEVSAKHVLKTAKGLYPEAFKATDNAIKKEQERIDNLRLIHMALKNANLVDVAQLFEVEHKKDLGL